MTGFLKSTSLERLLCPLHVIVKVQNVACQTISTRRSTDTLVNPWGLQEHLQHLRQLGQARRRNKLQHRDFGPQATQNKRPCRYEQNGLLYTRKYFRLSRKYCVAYWQRNPVQFVEFHCGSNIIYVFISLLRLLLNLYDQLSLQFVNVQSACSHLRCLRRLLCLMVDIHNISSIIKLPELICDFIQPYIEIIKFKTLFTMVVWVLSAYLNFTESPNFGAVLSQVLMRCLLNMWFVLTLLWHASHSFVLQIFIFIKLSLFFLITRRYLLQMVFMSTTTFFWERGFKNIDQLLTVKLPLNKTCNRCKHKN